MAQAQNTTPIYQQIIAILNDKSILEHKIPKKVFSLLNLATRNHDEDLLNHIEEFEQYFIIAKASKDKNILSCAISSSSINYIKKLILTSTYSIENQTKDDVKELLIQASTLGKNKCFELIFEHYQNNIDDNLLASLIVHNKNIKIADYIIKEKSYNVKPQFVSALKEKQLFREKIAQLDNQSQLELIEILTKALILGYIQIDSLDEKVDYKNQRALLDSNKIVYHSNQEYVLDSLITAIKFFENKDYIQTRQVKETQYFLTFKDILKKSVKISIEDKEHVYFLEGKVRELEKINQGFEKRLGKYSEFLKAVSYELFPNDSQMQTYLPFYEKYQLNNTVAHQEEEKLNKKRMKI